MNYKLFILKKKTLNQRKIFKVNWELTSNNLRKGRSIIAGVGISRSVPSGRK